MEKQHFIYLGAIVCISAASLYINYAYLPVIDAERLYLDVNYRATEASVRSPQLSQQILGRKNALTNLFDISSPIGIWDNVDINTVKADLSTNLYWKLSAPTDNTILLKQRGTLKNYWNEMFEKILTGVASNQEIQGYYNYQRIISQDYIRFTNHMLRRYANVLPEGDIQLLTIARNFHQNQQAKLKQQLEGALKRSSILNDQPDIELNEQHYFSPPLEIAPPKTKNN